MIMMSREVGPQVAREKSANWSIQRKYWTMCYSSQLPAACNI